MRSLAVLFFTLFSCVALFAQNDAMEYNDMIIEEQTKIGTAMNEFVISETPQDVDLNYKILLQQIDASLRTVEALGNWQGDDEFRQSALRLFGFYKTAALNEYKELATILKKTDDQVTDEDFTRMELLEEGIISKEKAFDQDFLHRQKAFADRNGFTLE